MLREFRIPKNRSVLVLEDMDQRIAWFHQRLAGIDTASFFKTALVAIDALQFGFAPDIIFLDHDLGFLDAADHTRPNGNGKEVARFLRESNFTGTVVLHSLNRPARDIMWNILPQAIIAPFGTFEIILI